MSTNAWNELRVSALLYVVVGHDGYAPLQIIMAQWCTTGSLAEILDPDFEALKKNHMGDNQVCFYRISIPKMTCVPIIIFPPWLRWLKSTDKRRYTLWIYWAADRAGLYKATRVWTSHRTCYLQSTVAVLRNSSTVSFYSVWDVMYFFCQQ